MQTISRCTSRRLTGNTHALNIAHTNYVHHLAFKSCVRGTFVAAHRPHRNSSSLAQPTLRRGHTAFTQAFVVPPALVRIAQKVVFRGASGRLLIETAKKGGWRMAAPLTAALFVYSVVATWFAARQTKELAKITDSIATVDEDGATGPTFLASSTEASAAPPASPSQSSSSQVNPAADACPICYGRGTITWDRFDVHEGMVCPRCLGTGAAKKRTTFFGK